MKEIKIIYFLFLILYINAEGEIDIDISTTTSGEGFEVKENVINLKETKSYINRCKFW